MSMSLVILEDVCDTFDEKERMFLDESESTIAVSGNYQLFIIALNI